MELRRKNQNSFERCWSSEYYKSKSLGTYLQYICMYVQIRTEFYFVKYTAAHFLNNRSKHHNKIYSYVNYDLL